MNNTERLEFLKKKPTYNCRFHPTDWWHEVGCPDRDWSKEELQEALNGAKRALELHIYDLNQKSNDQPPKIPNSSEPREV